MNKKKSKTMLAIILVGILGVISIAYAAISTTLYITSGGTATDNNGDGANTGATAGQAYVKFLKTSEESKPEEINKGIAVSKDLRGNDTATAGSVTITTTSKDDDTALIQNTNLGGFGSYVIYQLEVKNVGTNPVKLTQVPYINNGSTEGGATIKSTPEGLKDNISVKIYTDASHQTELTAFDDKKDQPNKSAKYLPANNSAIWYVKVSYINKPADQNINFIPGTFGFDLNPVWGVVG